MSNWFLIIAINKKNAGRFEKFLILVSQESNNTILLKARSDLIDWGLFGEVKKIYLHLVHVRSGVINLMQEKFMVCLHDFQIWQLLYKN